MYISNYHHYQKDLSLFTKKIQTLTSGNLLWEDSDENYNVPKQVQIILLYRLYTLLKQ